MHSRELRDGCLPGATSQRRDYTLEFLDCGWLAQQMPTINMIDSRYWVPKYLQFRRWLGSLDRLERSWYEMALKYQFRELEGMPFQKLFSEIMEKCHPGDFVRVCPWGQEGDLKNDGYLKSERKLFSVYAPERMNESETINKVERDFYGALPHWKEHLDCWIFVHNSIKGLPPRVTQRLLGLGKEHPELKISSWGYEELRRKVFTMSDAEISSLLGPAPSSQSMRAFGFAEIGIVVKGIEGHAPTDAGHISPASADKIKLNQLSDDAETLLLAGMRKSKAVEEFLTRYHEPTLGDKIAAAFRAEYDKLRSKGFGPDEIYFGLWEFAGGQERGVPKQESAVLAVISYLFEKCDIFEKNREDET